MTELLWGALATVVAGAFTYLVKTIDTYRKTLATVQAKHEQKVDELNRQIHENEKETIKSYGEMTNVMRDMIKNQEVSNTDIIQSIELLYNRINDRLTVIMLEKELKTVKTDDTQSNTA